MTRGGDHDKALPVLGRAHRQTMLVQEVSVDGLGLGIIEAFLGRELDGYADQLEGGEVSPGEVLGRAAVDDGPGEVGEEVVTSVGPLRRGGEAEGVGREEHLRDDRVLRGRQVVYLIVDYERKAIPVALGVDVGRVVGRHRKGCYLVVAAA